MRDSDEVTRAPALRRGFQVAERLVLQCALRGEYDVRPLFSGGAHGLDHFREGVIYLLKNSPWAPTKPNTRKPTKARYTIIGVLASLSTAVDLDIVVVVFVVGHVEGR
jgi:hypothetical protein